MKRSVSELISSPLRNVTVIIGFMLAVIVVATTGYILCGWSFADAIYMVMLTVYTVGYEEVRPINTPTLHWLTMGTMAFGCTGMILLTGALVQVFTVVQIKQLLGIDEVDAEIGKLKGHVIVCGFGRIGVMLAQELKDGGAAIVILERDEAKVANARDQGYLALQGDAAEEAGLRAAGIERARALATVVPSDSANVFITLTARSLNPALLIIARGDQPSTETKLVYAGADKVVLPTHIGAERIAEMILHPETARFIRGSDHMLDFDKTLRSLGLRLEMVTVPERAAAVGAAIRDMELKAKGGVFVVQIDRQSGDVLTRPAPETRIEAGDGVLVVTRAELAALNTLFHAPPEKVRAGRGVY